MQLSTHDAHWKKPALKLFFLMIFCSVPCLSAPTEQALTIYTLGDPKLMGDMNQIQGVVSAIKVSRPYASVHPYGPNELGQLKKDLGHLSPKAKALLIVATDSALDKTKFLPDLPHPKNLVTLHLSHQFTPEHAELVGVADFIALPKDTLDSTTRKTLTQSPKTTLIETIGVSHNLQPDTIQQAYEQHKAAIKLKPPYLAVMLAGDAPSATGELNLFTPADAQKLAETISKTAREQSYNVLVLNGPRTGKFDPNTKKEIPTAHRDGKLDQTTLAFVQALRATGLKENVGFQVFDFQFGQPSMYQAALYAVKQTGGQFYVPSESASMISECRSYIPPKFLTIFSKLTLIPVTEPSPNPATIIADKVLQAL